MTDLQTARTVLERRPEIQLGGRPMTTTARYDVEDPTTGRSMTDAPDCSAAEVDTVVRAAATAQRAWAGLLPRTRAAKVRGFAALLLEHTDELATLDALDAGFPLPVMQADVGGRRHVAGDHGRPRAGPGRIDLPAVGTTCTTPPRSRTGWSAASCRSTTRSSSPPARSRRPLVAGNAVRRQGAGPDAAVRRCGWPSSPPRCFGPDLLRGGQRPGGDQRRRAVAPPADPPDRVHRRRAHRTG